MGKLKITGTQQMARAVETHDDRIGKLEALISALKEDILALSNPTKHSAKGLKIPPFPRVLRELGYEVPSKQVNEHGESTH